MRTYSVKNLSRLLSAVAVVTGLSVTGISGAAIAADFFADALKLAPGVVKSQSYEAPPATYIVANPTNIFSDHFYYGTKVTGTLKRGEHVDALAKVQDYDWILVGKNGIGIGYVPISMLSPADLYHP